MKIKRIKEENIILLNLVVSGLILAGNFMGLITSPWITTPAWVVFILSSILTFVLVFSDEDINNERVDRDK